jgi:hypothetical protein
MAISLQFSGVRDLSPYKRVSCGSVRFSSSVRATQNDTAHIRTLSKAVLLEPPEHLVAGEAKPPSGFRYVPTRLFQGFQ